MNSNKNQYSKIGITTLTNQQSESSPQLLTIHQASKYLNVSESFFRSRIANNEIQFARIGRCIRIPINEVKRMIEYSNLNREVL